MNEAGFHQDLTDLLEDPITHRVMASDRVDMASLVDLLRAARQRLRSDAAGGGARKRKGRREGRPVRARRDGAT